MVSRSFGTFVHANTLKASKFPMIKNKTYAWIWSDTQFNLFFHCESFITFYLAVFSENISFLLLFFITWI